MDTVKAALKKQFEHVHPLIFLRSYEKAKSPGELFDLLDGLPTDYPIIWDESERKWKHTEDLLQSNAQEV
jgi:hypothetical protein